MPSYPRPPKPNKSGTADTRARRATADKRRRSEAGTIRELGQKWSGTIDTPRQGQIRTTGSSTKKVNGGKRIATTKNIEGRTAAYSADGKDVMIDSYNKKIRASDAVVKPRAKKAAKVTRRYPK